MSSLLRAFGGNGLKLRLFLLVNVLFICHLLLALLVVPPWQNPDEPQHVEFVRVLSRQTALDLSRRTDPAVQEEIFRSMAAHDWWWHIGRPTPDPVPRGFSEEPFFADRDVVGGMVNAPPLYYLLASGWVRVLGADDLLPQYNALRVLSALLAVLTLWCVWFAADSLTPSPRVAPGACLLLVFIPQFTLNAISAIPDMLVNLCGAFAFWQLARLYSASGRTPVSLALLLVSVAVALFTKRSGAPLLAFPLVGGLLVAARGREPLAARRLGLVAAAAVVALVAGGGVLVIFPGAWDAIQRHWFNVLDAPVQGRTLAFFAGYTTVLADSAWLRFGWMSYGAPAGAVVLTRLLLGAVVIGGLVSFWRLLRNPTSEFDQVTLFAAALVIVQVLAIYFTYYPRGWYAQGRYLYPVMGPGVVFAWLAFRQAVARGARRWAHALILAMLAAASIHAWVSGVLPTY